MSVNRERCAKVLELFELYYPRVFRFARLSLPIDQAEDISQEVFTKLLLRQDLEKMSISVSYLIKIADNLIKRRYQRSRLMVRYMEKAKHRHDLVECPVRQDRVRSKKNTIGEDAEDLESALTRLSDCEKQAVRFIVCDGISYEEAAASLGVPVTTVNNWKYRGIKKLEEYFDEHRVANEQRCNAG